MYKRQELDANVVLLARLERIRREAGARMGLGDVTDSVIPKPVLLAPGDEAAGLSLRSRYFTPHACHRAHAATGAVGVAAAFLMPGTVAHDCGGPAPQPGYRSVRIAHPSGGMDIDVRLDERTGEVAAAGLVRTCLLYTSPSPRD